MLVYASSTELPKEPPQESDQVVVTDNQQTSKQSLTPADLSV